MSALSALLRNPLLLRSQRQGARTQRLPWLLLGSVLAITLLLATIGGLSAESNKPAEVGTNMNGAYFSLAGLVVSLVGAAMGGHALTSEHQARTWEALLLTGMTPKRILQSKFVTAFANLSLYICALAPISSVAFVFGGVSAFELLLSFLVLLVIAALSILFGLLMGAIVPQFGSIVAVVLLVPSYLIVGLLVIGVGGSFLVGQMFGDIGLEGSIVWWPGLVARAPISLDGAMGTMALSDYLMFAWGIPLTVTASVGWLLYEAALAQLLEPGQDRMFGFKRAQIACTVAFTLLFVLAMLITKSTDPLRYTALGAAVIFTALPLPLLMLAGDDVYPDRRTNHELAGASWLRHLFAPGITRGLLLQLLVWSLGLFIVTMAAASRLRALAPHDLTLSHMILFDGYLVSFTMAVLALMALLRSAHKSVALTRLLTLVAIAVATVTPWALAAVFGGFNSNEQALVLAAPSPAYAILCINELSRYSPREWLLVSGGVCCLGYVLLAQVLFALAHRRGQQSHEMATVYQREVDERLAAEDRA